MDPLSITATVMAITTSCLKATKGLSDIREKYKYASLTIASICSESAVVSVSLSQIQNLCMDQSGVLAQKFSTRPELLSAFDTALTGCMQLYSCLNEEVESLHLSAENADDLTWTQKAKTVWKDESMKALLRQLGGIERALSTLLQCLQM